MKFDSSSLKRGIEKYNKRAIVAIQVYCDTGALQMQNYARKKAKWTDRTGRARTSLTAVSRRVNQGFKIEISYGVDYGMWLEMAHEKKYSILPETIKKVGQQQVIPGLSRLLERLGK